MTFSKFASRFRKSNDPAAATEHAREPEATAETPAADAAPASSSVAELSPAGPKPAADGAAPARASRLVEGERPRPTVAARAAALRAGLARASVAAKPIAARAAKPAAAAGLALAVAGLGYAGGIHSAGPSAAETNAFQRLGEATESLRLREADLIRLSAEFKSLRGAVDGLKSERERSRLDSSAKQAQLLEKLERAGQDNAARVGRLSEQLDRLEKAQRDPSRLQAFAERLDRIEKAVGSGATPSAPAPQAAFSAPTPPPKPTGADVTQTGSIEAKPARPEADPRKTPLEGYVLHDVDDGWALVETRAGRFAEVAVGHMLAGAGRVEAIERRGRRWVVVTQKGVIGDRPN